MECPKCGLLNPGTALKCDCGYSFTEDKKLPSPGKRMDSMSPQVKAALIIAGAIIVSTALWIYFSPFQSCVRAEPYTQISQIRCADLLGGGNR